MAQNIHNNLSKLKAELLPYKRRILWQDHQWYKLISVASGYCYLSRGLITKMKNNDSSIILCWGHKAQHQTPDKSHLRITRHWQMNLNKMSDKTWTFYSGVPEARVLQCFTTKCHHGLGPGYWWHLNQNIANSPKRDR